MPTIDYSRFVRVLTRCQEVAAEQGVPRIIAHVYTASAEAPIGAFLAAHQDYEDAACSFSREEREAFEALEELDSPYRVARSSVFAVLKITNLPDTLKMQRTDTDKLNAVERLLSIVQEQAGAPWADELLQGEFGIKGTRTAYELKEAIVANKALNKAQIVRANAYGPAYDGYLAFKHVVRDALGSNSKQYRRIHLRASAADDEESKGHVPPKPIPTGAQPAPASVKPASVKPTSAVAQPPASV